MADTVGALMVEAGMNLAGFEESVKQIPAITSKHMERMSAEMKRTVREGSESLRLIDEALGIHISRPLSRIIAEIPGVGEALKGLLGGAAFGAFAVAGVEFFDKLVKGIEHAQKAQEEFKQSTQKLNETYEDAMASYEKQEKLQSFGADSGVKKKLFEIDYSAADEARKHVDALTEAAEKNAKAAAEAAKWWIIAGAAIGDAWHELVTSDSGLNVEKINKGFETMKESLDKLSRIDAMQGTHLGLEWVQEAIPQLEAQMKALAEDQKRTLNVYSGPGAGPAALHPDRSSEIAAIQKQLDYAKQLRDILSSSAKVETGADNEAKKADAMERQLKAVEALTALQKDIGSGMGKLVPDIDPIKKMQTEIAGLKMSAENAFADMESSGGATKWQKAFGLDHLDEYKQKLDEFFAKFKQDTELAQSFAKLPSFGDLMADQSKALSSISGNDLAGQPNYLETAVPGSSLNLPAATPQTPTLGAGGQAQQQMDAFAADASAKMALVKKAEEDATTPLQKYAESVARLNIAFQGITDPSLLAAKTQALTLAWKDYSEATERAGESSLKLQKKLEDLEKQSDSAAAGVKAAITQLELNSATGKFTSSLTTASIGGFEDQTIKMLEGSKAHWSEYFKSIETMALKFAMNKAIASVLSNTSLGSKLGLGHAGAQASGAQMAAQLTANTTVTTANTAAITANTAAYSGEGAAGAAGAADSSGDSGTGNFASLLAGLIPHAAGGDVSPGQGYLVGENGPEPFFPGVSGSIAPNSSLGKGGDTIHNHYDFSDFKGDASLMNAVTAMVEKRGQQAEQRAVVQNNERSLRTTSGH